MPKISVNKSDTRRIRDAVLDFERRAQNTVAKRPDAAERKVLPNTTFAVVCEQDGGFAGVNGFSDCTFTYTVKNLRGNVTFGTGKALRWARNPLQEYAEGTAGLGVFDEDGVFTLWAVDEVPVCDPPPE